jgi:hypothetical protein
MDYYVVWFNNSEVDVRVKAPKRIVIEALSMDDATAMVEYLNPGCVVIAAADPESADALDFDVDGSPRITTRKLS